MLVSLPCVRWSVCNVRRGFGKFCVGEVGQLEIDLVSSHACHYPIVIALTFGRGDKFG